MAKYGKIEIADAYQVGFSDEDKASAAKGVPTTSEGHTIRHDSFANAFSVMIHSLGKHAHEGEWVITNATGNKSIMSDADFKEKYRPWDEDENEPMDWPKEQSASDQAPEENATKPAATAAVEDSVPTGLSVTAGGDLMQPGTPTQESGNQDEPKQPENPPVE